MRERRQSLLGGDVHRVVGVGAVRIAVDPGQFLDVGTGTEGAARSGDQQRAHVRFLGQPLQHLRQGLPDRQGDGVAPVRAVELQHRDAVLADVGVEALGLGGQRGAVARQQRPGGHGHLREGVGAATLPESGFAESGAPESGGVAQGRVAP